MSNGSQPFPGVHAWPSFTLGLLHRQARDAVDRGLADAGLALREYLVLVLIDELAEASQQQVAVGARIDRSDLVKILDRLQERELITRVRDRSDRRRHVLALTAAGRRALTRGTAAARQATSQAFTELTDDELATLHRLALKALGEDAPETAGAAPRESSGRDPGARTATPVVEVGVSRGSPP